MAGVRVELKDGRGVCAGRRSARGGGRAWAAGLFASRSEGVGERGREGGVLAFKGGTEASAEN